ncbi:MAG: GNAT family N-acetyltransferase [Bacteroidetes bacterium]|nr:MAG: GNAT family N-acetyltransferase [Bacteroidota bacterium]
MISIRKAKRGDEDQIMNLIKGLAEYEKAPEQVVNTAEELGNDLFVLHACDAFVAEESGSIIGFALFYTNYSTWKGKCLYLEDLYILPEYRRTGAGSMLFDEVIQEAKRRKVRRMDWQVLDWNEPAIEFYKKKGALLDPEWVNGRLFFE